MSLAIIEGIVLDIDSSSCFAAISHGDTKLAIIATLHIAVEIAYILKAIALDVDSTTTVVQVDTGTTIGKGVIFNAGCTKRTTNAYEVSLVLCTSAEGIVLHLKVLIAILPLGVLHFASSRIMTKLQYAILCVLSYSGTSDDIIVELKS